MIDTILALDHELFLLINHLPHTYLFNELTRFFSGIGSWGAIWIVIAVLLFFREEKRDHWFFLPVIFATTIGAILSEFILKWFVGRVRPTPDMGAIVVQGAGNFSFPSTHATLAFALAYVLSYKEPRYKNWFYILASLIALSRIYLGVHYPLDVVFGSLIGLGVGALSLWGERNMVKYTSDQIKRQTASHYRSRPGRRKIH